MIGDPGHMHKARWADRAMVIGRCRLVVRQTARPVMRTTEESRPALKGFETNLDVRSSTPSISTEESRPALKGFETQVYCKLVSNQLTQRNPAPL